MIKATTDAVPAAQIKVKRKVFFAVFRPLAELMIELWPVAVLPLAAIVTALCRNESIMAYLIGTCLVLFPVIALFALWAISRGLILWIKWRQYAANSELWAEMSSDDAVWFPKLKILLTKRHLVSFGMGPRSFKINDIYWVRGERKPVSYRGREPKKYRIVLVPASNHEKEIVLAKLWEMPNMVPFSAVFNKFRGRKHE